MSRIYPLQTQQSFTLFNNGVKITRTEDAHLGFEGGNLRERAEALLCEYEILASSLLHSINEGERYSDPLELGTQLLNRYESYLEARNLLQHFANNANISPAVKNEILSTLNSASFQRITQNFHGTSLGPRLTLSSLQHLISPRQTPNINSPLFRFHLHQFISENINLARQALRQISQVDAPEEKEAALLEAIRYAHRAQAGEWQLLQSRVGYPGSTLLGEQLRNLIDELRSFPSLPSSFDINLNPRIELNFQVDYFRSQIENQHLSQSTAAVRLLFSFTQRISRESPALALPYLNFLQTFLVQTLETPSQTGRSIEMEALRRTLSAVLALKNNISSSLQGGVASTGRSIPEFNIQQEQHSLQQLLIAYPGLLHSCPFLTVFFSPDQIIQHFHQASPVHLNSNLFMRMLSDEQLESYLFALGSSTSSLIEDYTSIPFERLRPDMMRGLLIQDHRYLLQYLMRNKSALIDCFDRMSPAGRANAWQVIRDTMLPSLNDCSSEIRERIESYESFREYLQSADLLHSLNLHEISIAQWLQLAYNYHHLEEVRASGSPIALITISRKRDDENVIQGTENIVLRALLDSHRFHVVYIPVGSDTELHEALQTVVSRSGTRIQKWFISAHGNETNAFFGDEQHEEENYDTSDLATQFSDLPNFFAADAEIVHNVCSNGEGGAMNPQNLTNQEWALFQRRGQRIRIHSLENPGSLESLQITAEGRFQLRWNNENQGYVVENDLQASSLLEGED